MGFTGGGLVSSGSTTYPSYLPCSGTYEVPGSKTGFYPEPPQPPKWGLLLIVLIIAMLLYAVWVVAGIPYAIDQSGSGGSQGCVHVPDSKAQQRG